MCSFIAGTTYLGQVLASRAVDTKSSAKPVAILAIMLAVAGATIAAWLQSARSMWGTKSWLFSANKSV